MRFPEYGLIPDTIFGTGILELRNGEEERIIWLRLPSWGYEYHPAYNEDRWGQRMLVYFGRRGLKIRWRFP